MNVSTRVENGTLFIDLEGRLDTITSQALGDQIPLEKRDKSLNGIVHLTIFAL